MEGINYPIKIDDWKKFEKINRTIALSILYTKGKKQFNQQKTNNSLNDSKRGRMTLSYRKKLSVVLHKKASNHKGNSYCLTCVNSLRTENKLKVHEKKCKNRDYCRVEMP